MLALESWAVTTYPVWRSPRTPVITHQPNQGAVMDHHREPLVGAEEEAARRDPPGFGRVGPAWELPARHGRLIG